VQFVISLLDPGVEGVGFQSFSDSLGEDTHVAEVEGAQELVGIGSLIGVIACLAVKGAQGRRGHGPCGYDRVIHTERREVL